MDSIRIKIRKLLALASDPGATDNERGVAMDKAQKLIEQHNIELGSIDADPDSIQVIKGDRIAKGFDKKFHLILGSAVSRLYECQNVRWNKGKDGHEFWGMSHQVEAAEETFLWIVSQVEELYRIALKGYDGKLDRAGRMELRASFKEACAVRVSQRIEQIIAERSRDRSKNALIVVNTAKAKLDEMKEEAGVKPSKAMTLRSGFGTNAGYQAGDHVRIQREVQR